MTKLQKKTIKKLVPKVQLNPLSWFLGEKQTFLLFATMIVGITVILFWRYLFGADLFIFNDIGSDTITIFYPNMVQAARYFQEAGIPGWSFYVGMGANTYPGYLNNPLELILLSLTPVTIAYSIAWLQAAYLIATGLVFYKFLREAQFSLPVCLVGGVIYTFGGYLVIGSSWYVHSHHIFWMTVGLLGFEWLLRKKIWWLFPIPFITLLGTRSYFLLLFMALFAAIRILDLYGNSWRELLGGYKRLLICGVFAFLFALPFIGGRWHRIVNSPRVGGDASYSDKLSDRPMFKLANEEQLLTALYRTYSNDGLGTCNVFKGWQNYLEAPAFYIGLFTLFMVFQFFALATTRRRWLYGIFLGFWVFLIVFPYFRYAFYGFSGNYYKGALSLFIPFSFLFVGLMGLQEIVRGRKLNLPVLVGSFLLLITLLWIPWTEPQIGIAQSVLITVSIFLATYVLILSLIWSGIARKYALSFLPLIIAVEAAILSWPAFNEREPIAKADIKNKKYHFDLSRDAVDYIKYIDSTQFYRIDKVYGSVKSGYNDGMVQGFFGTKMYQSFNPKNYVRFLSIMEMIDGKKEANTRWLLGLAFNQLLHPLFSIKYVLSDEKTIDMVDNVIYKKFHQIENISLYENTYFIPFGIPFDQYIDYEYFIRQNKNTKRLALYKGIVIENNSGIEIGDIPKVEMENPELDGAYVGNNLKILPEKAMKMESFTHNRITGSIDLEKPSVIFYSIPFDTGWKAKVDGVPRSLHMVHIGFTGLYVESGSHKIELYYEPPLSKWGWLGIIGAFLVAYLIYRYRKQFWK